MAPRLRAEVGYRSIELLEQLGDVCRGEATGRATLEV
jgi:hypothetical protein